MKSGVCTAKGLICTKSGRIKQLQDIPNSSVAESYITHSESEKKCARQIHEFHSHFIKNHPGCKDRAAVIQAPNEYGVKKFACTTIQPTLLANTELYNIRQCAEFVAGFVQYEPLSEERVIVTPTQTISWATGDAFDVSVFLASLLIGAGFDAYVVVGIAPSYICLKDQSHMKCTLVEKQQNLDPSKPWSVEMIVEDNFTADRKNDGLGLHCWVLVKPGKRDLTGGSCFVEPSTGIIYPLNEDTPYNEMWCAFNDRNYWINASLDAIPTDDISTWLQVLPGIAPFSYVDRLAIPPKVISLRYPPSGRTCLRLNKSKVECFGEFIDPQGAAMRIIAFQDEACTVVVQINELFYPDSRNDHLIERVRRPLDVYCSEKYSIKNPHFIRERNETASSRIVMFHPKTRADGLVKHEDHIGTSIIEHFNDRSDSLIRRVVALRRLPRNSKKPKHGDFIVCGIGLGFAEITRIDDHYDKPSDKDLKSSVAIRSYRLKEKEIVITYHCHHDALQTNDTYAKDDIYEPDSNGHYLLKLEASSIAALKKIHDEMVELREAMHHSDLKLLSNNESSHTKSAPKEDASEQSFESKEFDYLLPYLCQVLDNPNGSFPLTREEATKVRDACLAGLKERMMTRANLIQCRLNNAKEQLGRQQHAFQNKRAGTVTLEERQAFTEEVNEETFRVNVMEKRLRDHENTAIARYKALEKKLSEDERLSVLYKSIPVMERQSSSRLSMRSTNSSFSKR